MTEPEHKPLPTTKDRFTSKGRIASFGHAFSGLAQAMKTEKNARIHVFAALLVITAGIALRISANDWTWLVLAIGWVWSTELLNTAIEQVCDAVSPEFNPTIGAAKDIAAGAVLVSAIGAMLIGALRFAPYLAAKTELIEIPLSWYGG